MINRLYPSQIVQPVSTRATSSTLGFADAQAIADDLIARFEAGEFDVAHLFYSTLPVGAGAGADRAADHPGRDRRRRRPRPTDGGAAVEYEPDEEAILADLLPRNVAIQIFRALLENAASEQGAAMTAMDNATRNAGDLIKRADDPV